MARLAGDTETEHVVRGEEHRRTQTLHLQRPVQLDADALPDAARRQDHERQEDRSNHRRRQAEADQRLAPSSALPRVRDGERHEQARVELRRRTEAEQRVPDAKPTAHQSRRGARGKGRRPEVEAAEDDGAER